MYWFHVLVFVNFNNLAVSVWRGLRRLKETLSNEFENIEPLRQAADTSDCSGI